MEKTNNMKIGNPMDEDTVVGATISKEQAEKVLGYIDIAKNEVCCNCLFCLSFWHILDH